MKSKVWRDPVTIFAFRFALIFGLLICPWPGWNEGYGNYFRGIAEAAFSRDDGNRAVVFSRYENPETPTLNTKIKLANRALLDASGKGLIESTEFDTRSIGWVPTALTMALIVATPISWRRRVWALGGGMLLVHILILFSIQAWIWSNSTELGLLTLSPFWKEVAGDLSYTLITQLGASFAVPVLIWILVCFDGRDATRPGKASVSRRDANRDGDLRREASSCAR